MRTNYHDDDHPAYECSGRADRLTTPSCRSIAAATVDDAVAGALLGALTAEQVSLALAAADEVTSRHQRAGRAAGLAVERARYDAERAERAFAAVEPENRMVARTLETRPPLRSLLIVGLGRRSGWSADARSWFRLRRSAALGQPRGLMSSLCGYLVIHRFFSGLSCA